MRKQFIGEVISNKMEKTCVVRVVRFWQDPLYKKRVKRSKKYHAHNELGVKIGDKVLLRECKPISKTKKWEVVKKL